MLTNIICVSLWLIVVCVTASGKYFKYCRHLFLSLFICFFPVNICDTKHFCWNHVFNSSFYWNINPYMWHKITPYSSQLRPTRYRHTMAADLHELRQLAIGNESTIKKSQNSMDVMQTTEVHQSVNSDSFYSGRQLWQS